MTRVVARPPTRVDATPRALEGRGPEEDAPAGGTLRPPGVPTSPGAAIRFEASDGRLLNGSWWPDARAAGRTVVCLPAIGARHGYLRWFAGYLARHGFAVLTFDYRGVAGSAEAGSDGDVTLDDWVERDLPAAVAEASRRSGGRKPVVLAHSLGGQLLGQSPACGAVDGILLLASQRGIPRLFRGRARLRIEYAYRIFPVLLRLRGRLPAGRYTLPDPCPGPAILQWIRWGRDGVFTDAAGRNVEHRFTAFRGPLTAVTIADDADYAPAAAVDALVDLYTGARVRRECLSPAAFGLPAIGHFGVFRRGVPLALWAHLASLLADLAAGRPGEGQPESGRASGTGC